MVRMLNSFAVSVVLLVILNLSGSHAQVPTPPLPCIYEPLGNLIAGICFDDCIQEHGAINGTCNPNNICVCHYSGDQLAPPSNFAIASTILNPLELVESNPVQQCLVDDRTLPVIGTLGVLYNAYKELCTIDCTCVHGAGSGTCNFTSHQCHCNYPTTGTFLNVNNNACQYCVEGEAVNAIGALVKKISTTVSNLLGNILNPPRPGSLTLVPPLNIGGNCSSPSPA